MNENKIDKQLLIDSEIAQVLTCPICLYIMIKPMQLPCTHNICDHCLQNLNHKSFPCPVCSVLIDNTTLVKENSSLTAVVCLQKLRCFNNMNGCTWTGNYKSFKNHLANCTYRTIKCPNGCGVEVISLFLYEHEANCQYKKVHCNYCGKTMIALNLEKHERECPEIARICPQECDKLIKQAEKKYHIEEECPNTIINCPLKDFGCDSKVKRSEIENHEQKNCRQHIKYLCSFIRCLEQELVSMQNSINWHDNNKERNSIDNKSINKPLPTQIMELTKRVESQEKQIQKLTLIAPKCRVCGRIAEYRCKQKSTASENSCINRYSCDKHTFHSYIDCKRQGFNCNSDHDCAKDCKKIAEWGLTDK